MPRTDRISEVSLHHSRYRSNTRITAPPRSLTDHITRRAVTATAAHRRLKIREPRRYVSAAVARDRTHDPAHTGLPRRRLD